jgi:hypothetical protein
LTDADCGGRYCSPSMGACGQQGLAGYYCHTPEDQCIDDVDCQSDGDAESYCAYIAIFARWMCAPAICDW